MKITILTYGSSGDVLPYIFLALGLNESGHEVALAAPSNFTETVKGYGLISYSIFGDMEEILNSEDGRRWMAAENVRSFAKALAQISYRQRFEMQRDTMGACAGAEAIIAGSMMGLYAAMISEKLQIPLLTANVNPVLALTGDFPHFLVSAKPSSVKVLNKLSYVLMSLAYERSMKPIMNAWRIEMGLPLLRGSVFGRMVDLKTPVILGYSPALLPKPAEWQAQIAVTGEWRPGAHHHKNDNPSPKLLRWLEAGTAPIYFGFGSMPVLHPEEMLDLVKAICAETGDRAIVNAGWSQFNAAEGPLSENIYLINYADLDWLFPQCDSVVHHGGVGTTHICLASGIPPLICSVFADNAFWGERLQKLNTGRHIRFKDISKKKIIKALAELKEDLPRNNARWLGDQIKNGNGVKNAVEFINAQLPTAQPYVDWKGRKSRWFKRGK